MHTILGLDIGTTSIGFSLIETDEEHSTGRIIRSGVRIFKDVRDEKGLPHNQKRRAARTARRQNKRRRSRLDAVHAHLFDLGLLPEKTSKQWQHLIQSVDALEARSRSAKEHVQPYELGRAIYHIAKNRHFAARESLDEREQPEDLAEGSRRDNLVASVRASGDTLGQHLHRQNLDGLRVRDSVAVRELVEIELATILEKQLDNPLIPAAVSSISPLLLEQKPVFWRLSTLGKCSLIPSELPAPKGGWHSTQRRMLEKLNNLGFAGGNARQLTEEERDTILCSLQHSRSMTWPQVRKALLPLFKSRGEEGWLKVSKFNLETEGEDRLFGNPISTAIFDALGGGVSEVERSRLAVALPSLLMEADYSQVGEERIVLKDAQAKAVARAAVADRLMSDFGLSPEAARTLSTLRIEKGWDAFSIKAIDLMIPHLESGTRMGSLLASPSYASWRRDTFPEAEPTGAVLDRIPSPKDRTENALLKDIRNPTVIRILNETRKVVNNILAAHGLPDKIRVEMSRDVGRTAEQRSQDERRAATNRKRREAATKALKENGIPAPSHDDVDKYLLWEQFGHVDVYSGQHIGLAQLFDGSYQVDHIWPESRCFDSGFGNLMLCTTRINKEKGNRTPFEAFGGDKNAWEAYRANFDSIVKKADGPHKFALSAKMKRFMREDPLDDDFTNRQMVDTSHASRLVLNSLKRLWPDLGAAAPVTVSAVPSRITAQLRRYWQLNSLLSGDDSVKSRDDHRHHAVDALVVACASHRRIMALAQMFKAGRVSSLPSPWPSIRTDMASCLSNMVVSHRGARKVSGALHKEGVYGDTGETFSKAKVDYTIFAKRVPISGLAPSALGKADIRNMPKGQKYVIRDEAVRKALVEAADADVLDGTKKGVLFPSTPYIGKTPIKSVRVLCLQQKKTMLRTRTGVRHGYSEGGDNHHVVIYRDPEGAICFDLVPLHVAARRIQNNQPLVEKPVHGEFIMSLFKGDTLEIPNGDASADYWVVKGFDANGQVSLARHNHATSINPYKPRIGGLVKQGARKVAVDPIGRIRRQND